MRFLRRIYRTIEKFIYYGYWGTKCYDFDAMSIHTLIYAHMNRVNKFMHSDKTHTVWTEDPDSNLMRKLRELTELSKRMSESEMSSFYYSDKVRAKYPNLSIWSRDPQFNKELRLAYKRDQKCVDERLKRYYHILEKKVPHFWD